MDSPEIRTEERLILAERELQDIHEAKLSEALKNRKRLWVSLVVAGVGYVVFGWMMRADSAALSIMVFGSVLPILLFWRAGRRIKREITEAREKLVPAAHTTPRLPPQ